MGLNTASVNMMEHSVRFGGMVPPEVDLRLTMAAATYRDAKTAEVLLLDAQALDPTCLPVYFALYKFYFYRARLVEAERITLQALVAAARLSGFSEEWRRLTPDTADWTATGEPQHFYLFSLKALAFIRLRLGRADEAQAILAKLAELDPADTVGASVIRSLAKASAGAQTQ
jgi:tetratricopeptide (TPR) repeat protein